MEKHNFRHVAITLFGILVFVIVLYLSVNSKATMWVQADSGNISSVTWYRADNIEWDTNYLWPFNQKGSHKGYEEIRTSSSPLYIQFTPANAVNLKGVILGIYLPWDSTDYSDRTVTVELQESTDGGSTWSTVRSKTIAIPDDLPMPPVKQKGKYMVDFRFDTSYPLNTANSYRFRIYRTGGSGIWLQLSKDTSWSSWHSDVSDYAFRIIYSNTTGTPTDSDVFVITDELVIDQDWTVGYVTIPTSPSKDRLNSYNNKGSLWIASTGRLYIPSSITSDITVEVKGRMYISAGDRVAWQIGDSEENPIPGDKTVNWFFNCEGTSRRAGIYAYYSSWMKIEHYGSPIEKWYAILKYDASAGSNQIVVEGDVTDEWQVGDKIRVGGGRYSSTRHYNDWQRDHTYYEIASLSYDAVNNETTITLTSNLAYIHEAGGRVLLIRRNVNIYGDSISTTSNRAETYIYWFRWWKSYWVRFAYMRYPIYIDWFNPKIRLSDYPHNDVLKGVLIDNCYYTYLRNRRGGQLEKIATCDSRSSGWSWGEGAIIFYKCRDMSATDVVGLNQYFTIQISQSGSIDVSNFWCQANYPLYLYLASNSKIHDGVVFNSRYIAYLVGSSDNEFYNITAKNIYYDSNDLPTETSLQGCFYYAGDIISQNNYIHDIIIENAFSIITIDIDDGCTDWYHNITYSNITIDIQDIYRNDWLDQTRIRITSRNGIEYNDWIIYKYGEVHRTGNYTNSEDTTYRTEGGGNFALRLEPKISGEPFSDYKIRLTDVQAGKPVQYVGYIYVNRSYFEDATDYELPQIYIEGLGIDYNEEPTAKWTFPSEDYAEQWIPFAIVGTAKDDGAPYAVIKIKSDGDYPYVYIDDDMAIWTGQIDYRGQEIWLNGQPSTPPAEFPYIVPYDIWNQPVGVLKETGTIGRLITENSKMISPRFKLQQVNTTIPIIFALEAENPYVVKINIYKLPSATKVVDNQTMVKLGSTRYYYYEWFADEIGDFLIECNVPDLFVKDSMVITVLSEDEWWATNATVQYIKSKIDNEIIPKLNNIDLNITTTINLIRQINSTVNYINATLISKWGSLTAQDLYNLEQQTNQIADYINSTRWGSHVFADVMNKWGSYTASSLYTVSDQARQIADYINSTRWASYYAQDLYDISNQAKQIADYINTTRWDTLTANDLYSISNDIKTLCIEINSTTHQTYDTLISKWGSYSAEQIYNLINETKQITDYINGTRWATHTANELYNLLIQVKAISNYINTSRWQGYNASYFDNIQNQIKDILEYINNSRWNSINATMLYNLADNIENIVLHINQTTLNINTTVSNITPPFRVELTNFGELLAGKTYYAQITVFDRDGKMIDADSAPLISLYDANGNLIVYNAPMTHEETGRYSYSYATSSSQPAGQWMTIVRTTLYNHTVINIDYWELESNPPEVKIKVIDNTITDIKAKISITNEGGTAQEYTYYYWITPRIDGDFTDPDTIDVGSASKLINPGDTFTTTITLTLTQTGVFYFKVRVYYGTEYSSALEQFVAKQPSAPSGAGFMGGGISVSTKTVTIQMNVMSAHLTIYDERNNPIFSQDVVNGQKIKLPVGTYRFVFTADGYKSYQVTINLRKDMVVMAKLEKITEIPWIPIILIILIALIIALAINNKVKKHKNYL